jgi:cysteinyl-tRNA synthetase
MEDDLNTSNAMASLLSLVRSANRALNREAPTGELEQYAKTLRELSGVLGLLREKKRKEELPEEAEKLIELREEARRASDWDKADSIRKKLREIGVLIEDAPEGTKARLVRKKT